MQTKSYNRDIGISNPTKNFIQWLILIMTFLLLICPANSQNLLESLTWDLGTGSSPGYNHFGAENENKRILALNPANEEDVIWVGSVKDETIESGGWITSRIPINHNNDYRISVWLKKKDVRNGQGQLGLYCRDELDRYTSIDIETGLIRPYSVTFSSVLPELDKWYLVVGYIFNSSYTGTTVLGGVYDPVERVKVMDARNTYRFHPDAKTLEHFSFLYSNLENSQYFWQPRVDVVNEDMPTIEELMEGKDIPIPTELIFNYDTAGNNILRNTPEGELKKSDNTVAKNDIDENEAINYPEGFPEKPMSDEDRVDDLLETIKLSPNPTEGLVAINQLEDFQDLISSISANDLLGRSIPVKFHPESLNAEINLSNYPIGVYLVSFKLNDGRTIEKKIIKE